MYDIYIYVMHSSLNEWNERNRTSILFEIGQRNALTIIVLVQTIQLYTKWLRGYQLSSGKFIRFLFFSDMCATVGLNVGSYDKHLATCHIQFLKNILFHQKHDTNLIYILRIICADLFQAIHYVNRSKGSFKVYINKD